MYLFGFIIMPVLLNLFYGIACFKAQSKYIPPLGEFDSLLVIMFRRSAIGLYAMLFI